MKRKYQHNQRKIDVDVMESIKCGDVDQSSIKAVIRKAVFSQSGYGEMIEYMIERALGTEASDSKQRLRAAGMIEIVDGEAVPVEELTLEKVESVTQRRRAHYVGEIKTQIDFSYRHDYAEGCEEGLALLDALGINTTAEEVSKELTVVRQLHLELDDESETQFDDDTQARVGGESGGDVRTVQADS